MRNTVVKSGRWMCIGRSVLMYSCVHVRVSQSIVVVEMWIHMRVIVVWCDSFVLKNFVHLYVRFLIHSKQVKSIEAEGCIIYGELMNGLVWVENVSGWKHWTLYSYMVLIINSASTIYISSLWFSMLIYVCHCVPTLYMCVVAFFPDKLTRTTNAVPFI